MKQVKKSVLLWYSPHEMYSLVTDIPSYPKFLPWCERTEVITQDGAGMTARIHLSFAGVRQSFTTRNTHDLDRSVKVELVDGPFSHLQGSWVFKTLPSPDGKPQNTCKIEFELAYAFSSLALEIVLSPVFDKVANTFVDSFVKRAEQVYGER
jgi:ribosome-associated toxin RatA of RatAB toxin-antitoxin module